MGAGKTRPVAPISGSYLFKNTGPMKRTLTLAISLSLTAVLHAQCPDSTVIVYETDFELGNGGFVEGGFGDWEYGNIPMMLLDSTCTSSFTDPIGAHSGSQGWGTVLRDCYANSGDTSFVGLNVDLSDPNYTGAEVRWWQWYEVFTSFDYLFVRVNGDQLYLNNSTQLTPVWEEQVLDLTPYLGLSSVQIDFHLFATTVVNKAGWYLDDVSVTACVPGISTGLAEGREPSFHVWPVPATDRLNVRPSPGMGAITGWSLVDLVGRTVRTHGAVSAGEVFDVPVDGLHGQFVLELRDDSGVYRRQVAVR